MSAPATTLPAATLDWGRTRYAEACRRQEELVARRNAGETGDTLVFKASPKYELLAVNRIGPGESTNSSPAISNGEIFLRTNRHLWCISEKK